MVTNRKDREKRDMQDNLFIFDDSDNWEDALIWDAPTHKYVYRTESDELVEGQYPDNPCNCEHPSHFDDMPQYDPNQHEYLKVPASDQTAIWVGKVCDDCANGHYAQFVNKE